MRRAPNGELLVIGYDEPVFTHGIASVRRLDASGAPIAAFEMRGAGDESHALVEEGLVTEDGDVVACGLFREDPAATASPWIGAWDPDTGTKVWETLPGGAGGRFYAVTAVPGGYVAAGRISGTSVKSASISS